MKWGWLTISWMEIDFFLNKLENSRANMRLASSEMRVKMKAGCGVKIFRRDRICSYWQAVCGLKIDGGMRDSGWKNRKSNVRPRNWNSYKDGSGGIELKYWRDAGLKTPSLDPHCLFNIVNVTYIGCFLLFFSADYGGHGNSFHGSGGRGNKRAQMRYCLRLIRGMVSVGDDALNQDLFDQGAVNQIVGEFCELDKAWGPN